MDFSYFLLCATYPLVHLFTTSSVFIRPLTTSTSSGETPEPMSSFVTSTMGHKDRMAGDPSSSHRGEHRDREHRHRSSSSSHRHHRTISSTTLLLVLSLVLAVLAVMLSLPSNTASAAGGSPSEGGNSVLSYLTPKRTQALIARESAVAVREAEVARREAELLIGAPGGVIPSPAACPVCSPPMTTTIFETVAAPAATIIKEIVKEDSLTPPGWTGPRSEELLERELKIAERERDISKREENVNRREHDAARRESWIMEQLMYV